MDARAVVAAMAVAAALACGCAETETPLTPEQMKAQYAWDLGPAAIDVSAYPAPIRDEYALFQARCSRCHTLARPINSPWVSQENWTEFLDRMQKHSGGVLLTEDERKSIIEFLVFDGKQRKTTPQFQKDTKDLQALFKKIEMARVKDGSKGP